MAPRTPGVARVALGAAGAVVALVGIVLALAFGVAPVHITVLRSEPAQVPGGEFNLTLAPTGRTAAVPTNVTCIPAQGALFPTQEQDPACLPKDASHERVALAGLVLLAVGAIAWQTSGVERSLLRARSTTDQ